MSWRLGNSIRLRLRTGLQLWRTEVMLKAIIDTLKREQVKQNCLQVGDH
jgi:hypothetical protein